MSEYINIWIQKSVLFIIILTFLLGAGVYADVVEYKIDCTGDGEIDTIDSEPVFFGETSLIDHEYSDEEAFNTCMSFVNEYNHNHRYHHHPPLEIQPDKIEYERI